MREQELEHRGAGSDSARSFEATYGLDKAPKKIDGPVPEGLTLKGVDHTARPTWKLRETVEFYRDVMGLPLVHTISARGWGPPDHHDFLHFFFDSGKGSTIAFFYYIGSEQPDRLRQESHHFWLATHTAWQVDSQQDLIDWKTRLEGKGVAVSPFTRHEILESIYFRDPNGYPIEITRRLRDLMVLDGEDAALTLEAAIAAEDEASAQKPFTDIDTVWRRKAGLVKQRIDGADRG